MFAGLPLAIACARKISFSRAKSAGVTSSLRTYLRIAGRDVHGDVVHQFLEVVGASHEIALAVDFDEHTNLAAGVNVARHRPFAGHARRLLGRHRNALLAQNHDRLLHVAFGFGQSLLAIHHRSPGLFPEILHLCR